MPTSATLVSRDRRRRLSGGTPREGVRACEQRLAAGGPQGSPDPYERQPDP
jgi:hypothetical protein